MVTKLTNWICSLPHRYRRYRYKYSFKKAVKNAMHVKFTTGEKCLVLFVNNELGYKCFKKQALKTLCKSKYFKKGTTARKLERMAEFTTH